MQELAVPAASGLHHRDHVRQQRPRSNHIAAAAGAVEAQPRQAHLHAGHVGEVGCDLLRAIDVTGLEPQTGQEHAVEVRPRHTPLIAEVVRTAALDRIRRGGQVPLLHEQPGAALVVRGDGKLLRTGAFGRGPHPLQQLGHVANRRRGRQVYEFVQGQRCDEPLLSCLGAVGHLAQ